MRLSLLHVESTQFSMCCLLNTVIDFIFASQRNSFQIESACKIHCFFAKLIVSVKCLSTASSRASKNVIKSTSLHRTNQACANSGNLRSERPLNPCAFFAMSNSVTTFSEFHFPSSVKLASMIILTCKRKTSQFLN